MPDYIEVQSNGIVMAKTGINPRMPYMHQKAAMANLNIIDKEKCFSTLVVLPTGGGKTYTASTWLLKNAIDKKKKIIWIAHRQMLLDQAAESFRKFAYAEAMPHISEFTYRIISGSTNHDRCIDISPKDNILIMSKDSIGRNLTELDRWLKGETEIYFVVDEAHHATAKTYRKIIQYVKERVPNVKLLGLTATPFRTAEEEEGLLAKIFTDGVADGAVVKNALGMAYQISLKELIAAQILSNPIFESKFTEEDYGANLGLDALERINHLDKLPDEVASEIAKSAARNKLIVETYLKKQKEYGQTIIFAVSINHAVALNTLFHKAGVPSDFIVSDIRDVERGYTISREENDKKLQAYREGKLKVLINVNILTEGVDLPQTKTVFLARPTVSKILMTQMVGRALRGTAAGGTKESYIVSFIDEWNERIAWCNPATLFEGLGEFQDDQREYEKRQINLIAISKIEEFARILDDSIDTTKLESVPFVSRIPVGMYAFTYLEEDGMDLSYQVMVYDSTRKAYQKLCDSLQDIFADYGIDDEYLSKEQLAELEKQISDTYFYGEMVPPYEERDIVSILKYYAQYEEAPPFYTFDEIDSKKLDLSLIAKTIYEKDMGIRAKSEYIDRLWNDSDDNLLRMFFGRKIYFMKQLDIEILKLTNPEDFTLEDNVRFGRRKLEDMTLSELREVDPKKEAELRDGAFDRAKNKNGEYVCQCCGMKSGFRNRFQVDHIIPMNRGGKSVPENLQILCRSCNAAKGDK